MPTLVENHYPGLWQGPIDHKASSVINAIVESQSANDDDWVDVGDSVYLTGVLEDELLSRVDYTRSSEETRIKFIGIVVDGDEDGIYVSAGDLVVFTGAIGRPVGDVAGFNGDAIRICTQGRCIIRVDQIGSPIAIGDPITPHGLGTLRKAISGDNVVARALQPVPIFGLQYIAADVQREGILP